MSDPAITCAYERSVVIAVFNSDIIANRRERNGTTEFVIGVGIFTIPMKILASHIHSFDKLTEMVSTGLQQDEGGVGGERNEIGCISIRAAAVVDFGIANVQRPIWERTAVLVNVVVIFVIPIDISRGETCATKSVSTKIINVGRSRELTIVVTGR